ncbi:MAG: Rieske 2Fe-2S domain-containing protein [Acidobacteriota bacterium]
MFFVMGQDRRLRAFHNICRHRGTQLIRAVGKTEKVLTCPYHDWTYDLEGRLLPARGRPGRRPRATFLLPSRALRRLLRPPP